MNSTLVSLLQTWREHRQPDIADLAEAVTAALLAADPRPALGASKRAADRSTWRAIAALQDPLDFPRLMAAARGGAQIDVNNQVQYLRAWQHPSFARGLLALLENPPYAGIKSRPMLEEIFDALADTRDVRLVKPARALAKRYLAIVNSSTGGWIVSELVRIAKAVEAFSPPEMSEDERRHYDSIVQSLPPEFRPRPQATESSGPSIEALLAEVYQHPEDDERRLLLAQALLDENDERGEFIQLQIAAARGKLGPEQTERLQKLATPARLAGWAQPLSMSGACAFERGFPVAIELYKTALKSLGDPAWATIKRVKGLGKISNKAARELLDHPSLANVEDVAVLTATVLASLENRVRLFRSMTLIEDKELNAQLLRRCPELRHLKLWLHGGPATGERQLLWELPHLQKLELRSERESKNMAVSVPPTVTEATVDGSVTPGVFAYASALEKLHLSTQQLTREHLEGLSKLRELDVRADHIDGDTFEAVPKLATLRLYTPGRNRILSPGILHPLRELKHLDLNYMEIGSEELAPLERLEEIRHFWTYVNNLPSLPRLSTFHCMLPYSVAEIERLIARQPALRTLEFCWNSSSELWFSGEPDLRCERAWQQFADVLCGSNIESWASDEQLRLIRQGAGWRIEFDENRRKSDWGFPRFVLQVMRTFRIPKEMIPAEVRGQMKHLL